MTEEAKELTALEIFAQRPRDRGPRAPAQADVRVGQVWEEADPRGGRTVTVKEVAEGETHAVTVEVGGDYPQTFTVNRSHFGSPNGYKLVKDVE